MRTLSVFQTLFFWITGVIGLMFLGAYLLISAYIEEYAYEQIQESLYRQTLIFSSFIDRIVGDNTIERDAYLRRLEVSGGERITLIDPVGVVLYDTEANPDSMDNHAGRPEIVDARKYGWGSSRRYSRSVNKDMIYVATQIYRQGAEVGFIRLSVPLENHLELLEETRATFLQAFFIAGVLGLLAIFVFSRDFAGRIRRISEFATAIADRNLDYVAEFRPRMPRELDRLVIALEGTARRMQNLFKRINREKQKLKGIIEDITQGLVIISRKGKIYLINNVARDILGDIDQDKKKYWKVFGDKSIIRAIEQVKETRELTTIFWEREGKFFDVHFKFFPRTEETFIIFNDITGFVELEQRKKEFVANVSHELRTPLTAMKGFLEHLEGGQPLPPRHLEIIRRNTDRLIALVKDLMTLAELEHENLQLQTEDFDLVALIEQIIDLFESQIAAKNLRIERQMPEALIIHADLFKTEAVLYNLISNAIKYTEEGSVGLVVSGTEKELTLIVRDTGVGIATQDQERIFERFYVVDKSRSRRFGGTGLGLAIVKHIVRLHGGHIAVESEPDKGTRFIITMPLRVEAEILENDLFSSPAS
jgi:two-component system phosphate regulon sensor histidine kinase PhoR